MIYILRDFEIKRERTGHDIGVLSHKWNFNLTQLFQVFICRSIIFFFLKL